MKNKVIQHVLCYCRVSTASQAEEGYSIDQQIERLTSYCKAMDWKIVKFYTDAGYTGANMDRPALQDLISAVSSRSFDAVVVYKLDRLSRSQRDTLTLIEGFLDNDTDFVSMTENFDTSSPFGKATIGILSVFAQLEREQIKERCSLGRAGRAREGKYRGGGYIPIGYDYQNGELKVNVAEAEQIRLIHKLYQSGETFRSISFKLKADGITHKYGAWEVYRISRMIKNPLYAGFVTYKGETIKGIHEPIISEECFQKTMEIYRVNNPTKQPHIGRSLLGGLLFCARCGARYGISRTSGNSPYQYYCCHSRRKISTNMIKDPNCKNKNWRKDDLESLVLAQIRQLNNEPLNLPDQTEIGAEIDVIMDKIGKIDRQRSRFMDLYGSGMFDMDELEGKIRPLIAQKQKFEAELDRLRTEPTKKSTYALIETFADVLEQGDSEQVRLLVRSLVNKIEIDGEDITIFWNFD